MKQGRGAKEQGKGAENQGDVGYGAKGMGLQPSVRGRATRWSFLNIQSLSYSTYVPF